MQSKFDIYLARVVGLVQIGLFAVSLATIYYTVVPLYKSAQIEEALARKEMEYQKLSMKMEMIYTSNRALEIADLVAKSINCLGWESAMGMADSEFSWELDIAGCLDERLKKYSGGSLSEKDYSLLVVKVDQIKKEVLKLRAEMKRRSDSYEVDLSKDPSLAPKEDPMIKKLDSLGLALGMTQKDIDRSIREQEIRMGRAEIVRDFLGRSTDIVKSMKGIKWLGNI